MDQKFSEFSKFRESDKSNWQHLSFPLMFSFSDKNIIFKKDYSKLPHPV